MITSIVITCIWFRLTHPSGPCGGREDCAALFHVISLANELGFYLGLATKQRTKLHCVKVPLNIARAS
jgi:hypothetical protein